MRGSKNQLLKIANDGYDSAVRRGDKIENLLDSSRALHQSSDDFKINSHRLKQKLKSEYNSGFFSCFCCVRVENKVEDEQSALVSRIN